MSGKNPVVACITAQLSCKNIIEAGRELAEKLNCGLTVVTIQKREEDAERRARDLKILDSLSKLCDCDISIIYSNTPVTSLSSYVNKINPCHILIGNPNSESSFFNNFIAAVNSAPVSVVNNKILYTIPAKELDVLINKNKQ